MHRRYFAPWRGGDCKEARILGFSNEKYHLTKSHRENNLVSNVSSFVQLGLSILNSLLSQ